MNSKRLAVFTHPLLKRLLSRPSSWKDLSIAWDVFAFDSLHFARRFRDGSFLGFRSFRDFGAWFASSYAGAYVRLGCPQQAWSADWVCRSVSDFIREEVER